MAFEHRVLLDVNLDEQITARTAVDTRLAVTRRANPHTVVDTCRDLHFQRLCFLHLACAVAMTARLRNIGAGAMTLRAGLLDAEKALRHAHGALPLARRTGCRLGAGLRSRALADPAIHPTRHADLRVVTVRRPLQRNLHAVTQIGATIHLRATVPTSTARRTTAAWLAEDAAADVAARLGKPAKP